MTHIKFICNSLTFVHRVGDWMLEWQRSGKAEKQRFLIDTKFFSMREAVSEPLRIDCLTEGEMILTYDEAKLIYQTVQALPDQPICIYYTPENNHLEVKFYNGRMTLVLENKKA